MDNAKGRNLLASTITMVHPSGVETTTEETSEAAMAGLATSHAEIFMKYQLMISYRTSPRNNAATKAMVIMLMTQRLIGWCINKAQIKLLNEYNYCCVQYVLCYQA